MSIHVLPEELIAQIAAGEVIERPASVVKELVENALDAGANNIRISVNGGGRKLIRVSDDGSGIAAGEVELAFTRHATSKLATIHDLEDIRTLGFRGEALSSIAAVSRISVTTRHREDEVGAQLRIEGGTLVQRQSTGAPAGTVISVENLFYNTPARLKFLKKENTEKRYIASIVTRYALAYPDVRITLEQDGREVFRSSGSGELADVMLRVMGLDNFKQMVEVAAEDEAKEGRPAVSVAGYTSMPDHNRADRSHITLFVNGRWIQDTSLTYAVVQAYHTLLMTGRFPVAILMIGIAPDEVDVNVHPTKAEVRFRDSNAVFSAVQRAVRQAVIAFARTPAVRGGRIGGFAAHPSSGWDHTSVDAAQLEIGLELEDGGHFPRSKPQADDTIDPTEIPEGPGAPLKPRTLPMLRVIGQVGAMYLVAEGPAGLYLIDQHAAHERILYEQFMDVYERKEVIAQHTLDAQTIDLSPAEARLVEDNLAALQSVGFALEPFGPNTFAIRAVPAMLADGNPVEVVSRIIDDLELEKRPGHDAIEQKLIRQVCRHAAVKAGQILSHEEMQALVRQLERCRSPHTCPHGRPTMIHMSGEQLAHEFGRS
jgi:DNA mismatch repair protein MutL